MSKAKWIMIIIAAAILALGIWKFVSYGPEPTPVPQEQEVNH